MAAPHIASSAASGKVFSFPGTVALNDLLLACFSTAGATPTPPAGWELEGSFTTTRGFKFEVWSRLAPSAGPFTAEWTGGGSVYGGACAAYRDSQGVAAIAFNEATPGLASHTASTVSSTSTERVVSLWTAGDGTGATPTPDVASNTRLAVAGLVPGVYDKVGGPGLVTGTILSRPSPTYYEAVSIALMPINAAPNAPALTSLTGGVSVDRATVNRASWTFSDADAGDTQSQFTLDYKIGGVAQTPITQTTPNNFYDFPAGSLAAGAIEWGVTVKDNGSPALSSPRSASGFFTAANMPTGPTITAPTNGATVERYTTLTWSVPDQDEYQVKRTSVDGVTEYYNSGELAQPAARSLALDFSVNSRSEKVWLRIKEDGLWTGWVSIIVNVSFSPPPVPEFEIQPDPEFARLLIPYGNPAPGVGEVATVSVNVWIDDGKGKGFERMGTELPPNSTFIYWDPVLNGRDYTPYVYVEAVAANGSISRSA